MANKYELYTRALQDPKLEAEFLSSLKPRARILREDFCGTAEISFEWVANDQEKSALVVDIDPDPIKEIRNRANRTDSIEERIKFREADATQIRAPDVDIVTIPNSSVFLVKERDKLKQYFENIRSDLVPGGILVIDFFGGGFAQGNGKERLEFSDFSCIWEQDSFNYRNQEFKSSISFELDDGQVISNAFTYNMRLWSPRELGDVIADSGFSSYEVRIGKNRFEIASGNLIEMPELGDTESWEAYIIAYR